MDPKILYLPRCRCHRMSFSPKMLKNLYRWPASQWINKQNAFHGIAGSPLFTGSLQFPGASFSRFLNIIFITVAWPAFKSSANCAIYKCFGQWLFCFNCLFTNLQGPQSSYIRFLAYKIFKTKMAPHGSRKFVYGYL